MLSRVSPETARLAAISIGALVTVVVVLCHGIGLHHIVLRYIREAKRLRSGSPRRMEATILFGWAVFLMLVLHLAEVIIWGISLQQLGLIANFPDAFYFSANTYTTLGYGEVLVPHPWRDISPIIGISGLFTFAWTGSTLVNVVQRHYALVEQLADEYARERELRTREKAQERLIRAKELEQETALRAQEPRQAFRARLRQRHELRKEEKRKLRELRVEEESLIEALRRREREQENKLGEPPPPDTPKDED